MRRSSESECIEQKSELLISLFFSEAEHLEHLLLKLLVVDTDRTAADLRSVDHEVICICAHRTGISVEERDIVGVG